MSESLLEVVAQTVFEGEKPAKAVAEEIGKPYRTLMRELNDADDLAKLGADMLIPIMRSTGSIAPLQYLAHRMGYRISPITDREPTKPTLAEECMETYPAVVAYHALLDGKHPLADVGQGLDAAIRELEEDFVSYRKQLAERA